MSALTWIGAGALVLAALGSWSNSPGVAVTLGLWAIGVWLTGMVVPELIRVALSIEENVRLIAQRLAPPALPPVHTPTPVHVEREGAA